MTADGFRVRPATAAEFALFPAWAEAEGWNPGRHDLAAYRAADPDGFLVGELAGEPVAIISCVRYPGFGFLGHYIVKPEFRGKGYGLLTWNAGMASFGGRNVGLDGVMAQVPNYERSGFLQSHLHVRHGGPLAGRTAPGVVRLDVVPFADVLAYDRRCFPADRPAFLAEWVKLPEAVALGVVRDGSLAGYAVARRCVDGFRVGPLFADDAAAAEDLMMAAAKEVGGREPLYVDAPPAAVGLVRRLGLTEGFTCARMYTRGVPAVAAEKVFGVTTLELG